MCVSLVPELGVLLLVLWRGTRAGFAGAGELHGAHRTTDAALRKRPAARHRATRSTVASGAHCAYPGASLRRDRVAHARRWRSRPAVLALACGRRGRRRACGACLPGAGRPSTRTSTTPGRLRRRSSVTTAAVSMDIEPRAAVRRERACSRRTARGPEAPARTISGRGFSSNVAGARSAATQLPVERRLRQRSHADHRHHAARDARAPPTSRVKDRRHRRSRPPCPRASPTTRSS